VKKNKSIETTVGPIFNQTLREIIRDCDLSILKIAALAKVSRSNLQTFYQGKKDCTGSYTSKVFQVLPEKSQKQFAKLLLVKLGEQNEYNKFRVNDVQHKV